MQLFLFRHGIAEDSAESDFSRNLTPRGVEFLTEQVKGLLKSGLTVDRIYTSNYNRALQTAEILSKGLEVPLTIEPLLGCGCHFMELSDFLEMNTEGLNAVICVGHQPDLGNIAYKFTGKQVFVHKGSLIHIEVNDWISHGGVLKGVYEPEQQIKLEEKQWF